MGLAWIGSVPTPVFFIAAFLPSSEGGNARNFSDLIFGVPVPVVFSHSCAPWGPWGSFLGPFWVPWGSLWGQKRLHMERLSICNLVLCPWGPFGRPWGLSGVPLGPLWGPLGGPLGPLGAHGVLWGLPWGPFGAPGAAPGVPWGPFWVPWGCLGVP